MSSRTYSSSSTGTSSPASSSSSSTPHRPSLSSNFSFSATGSDSSSPHTSPANSRRSTSRSPIPLRRHDSLGSCSYRSARAENNHISFGHPLEGAVSRASGSDESEGHFGIRIESFEVEEGADEGEEERGRVYRRGSLDFLGFEKDDWNPYTQEQRDRMNTDQRVLRYCAILKYQDPPPLVFKESSSHVDFAQGQHETESEYNGSEYGHEGDFQPPVPALTSLLPIPIQQQITPTSRRPSHQRTSSVASTSDSNQNFQPPSHSHSLFRGLRNRLSPTRSNGSLKNLPKPNQKDKLIETWNLGRVSDSNRSRRSSRIGAENAVSPPPRYGVI